MRHWIVTLLAAIVGLASLIHAGPVAAGHARGGQLYAVSDRHDDVLAADHAIGMPGKHRHTQPHDAQAGGCQSGICGLCGLTLGPVAVMKKGIQIIGPVAAALMIARRVAPPLRPPTLPA